MTDVTMSRRGRFALLCFCAAAFSAFGAVAYVLAVTQ